ncbi:SUKH-4 family immunity protein [Nocardiopsis sediminis]|uniref:SUKH-4 family immunity protein n=1 Tax=Nocardiopsis sediminis TaxID=1778267 RepID=A0ABV8FMC9_9ACTN
MADRHDDLRVRADRVLDDAYALPLDEIVDARSAAPLSTAVEAWDVPAEDHAALQRWGLPEQIKEKFFENAPQDGAEPELSRSGRGLYRLGRFNRLTIGVEAGTGRVRALPRDPDKANIEFNHSLTRYIECAWRWHSALPVLIELVNWAWDPDQLDFYEEKRQAVGRHIAAIDPDVASAASSLWQSITDI